MKCGQTRRCADVVASSDNVAEPEMRAVSFMAFELRDPGKVISNCARARAARRHFMR